MGITDYFSLPTDEELTVQEVDLSYPILHSASFYLGKYCEHKNNEFMLCKSEEEDPRRCINEGKCVTACTLEFFNKLKKHCNDEFTQYYNCIDKSSGKCSFTPCRKTQSVLDACVLENLKIKRPEFGYFCEVKVHDSKRPKPKINVPDYPDAAVPVSPDEPKYPPKYQSRRIWAH